MPPLTGFRATFRCLRDVEMDFTSPEDGKASRFIALVGVNGAGKTTVLEGIAQSVLLFARFQVESPFLRQGESVELVLGKGRLVRRREEQFKVLLPDGTAVVTTRGKHKYAVTSHRFGAVPHREDELPERIWAARPANLERALFIRSGYVPTLPAGKQLEMGPARGMSLELALLPDNPEQRVAAVHQWWLHMHWEYPKTTTLDRLWAALKPFLGDLVYAGVNPQDHLPWFDDRGTRVSFNELSSGQRRLILLFLEIFMQCGEDGLVLFDEPEAHFHPHWQRELPKALCELVPNGQVIVATHAPHIVDGRPAHQVFVLGDLPWERTGVLE
jgi:predicted ATPase